MVLAAILVLACAILVPETLFNRELVSPTNPGNDDTTKTEKIPHTETVENLTTTSINHPGQVTGLTSMLEADKCQSNALQKFSAPWKILRLPGVWLVMLWYVTAVRPTLIASRRCNQCPTRLYRDKYKRQPHHHRESHVAGQIGHRARDAPAHRHSGIKSDNDGAVEQASSIGFDYVCPC